MTALLSVYLGYVSASVRGQLQHRAATFALALGQLLGTGLEFVGALVLLTRFGAIGGWTLSEIAVLYGIVHVGFALAELFARGFDNFERMIRAGEFDRVLLRPRSAALQVLAGEVQLSRLGRTVQGLVVLGFGVHANADTWTASSSSLLAIAVLAGACTFAGTFVLQATICFWTVSGLELANTVTYGAVQSNQYPLPIYPRWMQRLFTYVVPVAATSYWPALGVLGRAEAGPWLLWCLPLLGPLYLAAALWLWSRVGVRHYQSTGS